MKLKISDIVDIPKLQSLMESFYAATGIPLGILDVHGEILVAVGWREICSQFHRKNPHTEALCIQSDSNIQCHLHSDKPYIWYKCANGLIDAAAPIIVNEVHLATIFQGQFLFDAPDVEEFRQQAKKYGFNENEYLEALNRVPIYSREKLDSIMHYFQHLAQHLAEMGMTKLRLLEAQHTTLRDFKNKMKSVLDDCPHIAVRVFGEGGDARYFNPAAEHIYNVIFKEIKGQTIIQMGFDSTTVGVLQNMLAQAEETFWPVGPVEWSFKNKAGMEKHLYTTILPVSFFNKKDFICMDFDVTERKQLEHEMARMEKLNLVGEMAAGIGHEVRNPMTTVRGFLQLLSEKEECKQHKDSYNLMIDELDRVNSIITEFLTLAKNRAIKPEMKNLNVIISSVAPLLEANALTLDKSLIVILEEVPELLLDEQEIKQLLLNLVRNGMEAMDPGGCLTIRTYIDQDNVVLSIEDQGHGIPLEIMDKLGSPFFSTKEHGTGLGLAVCYSIAARHKAQISVESGNEGCKFYVKFKI